jgi:hypothetical protein
MRALEIDPKARYQTAGEMAADLERTLIAARYSSRELSKLLHDLYVPNEDPVVVVEEEEAKTTIATSTTHTATGSVSGSSSGSAVPERTSAGRGTEHDSSRLGGALRAERARLQRTRWRGRAKIAFIALAVGAAAGGLALGVKRVLPIVKDVMKPAPPPVTANQTKPAPEPPPPPAAPAKPARKHTRKAKPRPTDEAPGEGAAPTPPAGSGDTPSTAP